MGAPSEAELRVEIEGGEFIRTEAGQDTLALVEQSVEWQQTFKDKGWSR